MDDTVGQLILRAPQVGEIRTIVSRWTASNRALLHMPSGQATILRAAPEWKDRAGTLRTRPDGNHRDENRDLEH